MALRVLDKHGVCERDVQAVLNDCGAYENVVLVFHEAEQYALQLCFAHLPMPDADSQVRQHLLNHCGTAENRIDSIVNEVDLAATAYFLLDCTFDQLGIEMSDDGMNSEAVFWRRFDDRHIA